MSYILEALKKAQAERQLGSAPTIHAPAASVVTEAGANRKPMVIGFAAGAVLVAAALMLWRHQAAPVPAAPVASVAPVAAPPVAAVREAAPVQPAANPPSQVALVGKPDAAPKPEPVPVAKPPERELAAVAKPAEREPVVAAKLAVAAATPAHALTPPAAPAPAAGEESLPAFGALPEATRRDIPKVAFGGYMYSPNPSDRLILIDNVLRHEGEEVAPGLVLEKLLPKGAVMNYRGSRYRVPF